MALSGTFTGTTANQYITSKIVWSATQDKSGNFSTVTATLYYSRTNTGYTTNGTWSGSITINGVKTSESKAISITYNSNTVAMSATVKVPHNADGTKSITISASGGISSTSMTSTSISKTVTLDTIPRASTISATIADVGGSTTITINSASNSFTHQVTYTIGTLSGTVIERTSFTSFSWVVPETFYTQMINSPNWTCTLYCTTYNGSTVIGTTDYNFIVNANSTKCSPVLNPTVIDEDTKTVALTGDNNKLIKYYSDASIAINASGQYGATIKSYKVTNGGSSSTIIPVSIADVESGTFTFTATDSRGFTTTKTITKTLIDYVRLTCNIAVDAPTAAGDTTVKITGNYFNGSFGAASNTITVQYRQKENDGSYGAWTAATATLSGNTYTATINLTGLNYLNSYTFQARAIDKLADIVSAEKKVKTTPVFDWSENDFAFNVPVTFSGRLYGESKILWSGASHMNGGQYANLTEAISKQTFGIILVFSQYNNTAGNALNLDWHYYVVPKYMVSAHSGNYHTFNMMSLVYNNVASKSLYIFDGYLSGIANNTATGTNNGITYNNSNYVLRYVIGV